MENKNTKAKGWIWRHEKEMFFADGAMIQALYEKMDDILRGLHTGFHKPERTLRVFNYAYDFCWQLTENHQSRLDTLFVDSDGNANVRIMTYTLAFVLLNIHNKFDELDESTQDLLQRRQSDRWTWELLLLAKNYQTDSPAPATDEPLDFDKVRLLVTAALTTGKKLQAENESLRRKLETENQMHENIVASWKLSCDSLSQKLDTLRQQLAAWENNKFYQAVNIGTIVDYAQGQKENKLDVIKMMLLELCANKVDDDVIQKIKDLRSGGTFNINEVGQMYPNATQVTNHYHNPPKDETND